MRAAQSKGQVDLLALWPRDMQINWNPSRLWLVQAKYSVHGGGYLPGKEAEALVELAALTGGLPVFARPGKNGRGVEFINLYSKEIIV